MKDNKKNWCNVCATDDNRNQCRDETCILYPICKIKEPTEVLLDKIVEIFEDEIKVLERVKEKIPVRYLNAEPTIANQEVGVNASLATLNELKEEIKKWQIQ